MAASRAIRFRPVTRAPAGQGGSPSGVPRAGGYLGCQPAHPGNSGEQAR